jgi:tetratricopeptide (TPR) repeat protein
VEKSLTLAALVLAASGFASEAQAAAPPWEAQPLAAEPREVLKAAAAAAAGATSDVVILYEEGHFSFDAEGRCDHRYRLVYLIRTDAGAREWASLGTQWAPWYEERPVIRARVITPDGRAHDLDPKTVGEAPVSENSAQTYSDRRRLGGPLPAVAAGAVVEEEVRTVDKAPLFAAGTQYRFLFGAEVPVQHSRVLVEAPESLLLHHVLRGAEGLTVERERAEGRVRLSVDAPAFAALERPEPWMPADRPRRPYFAFATGASWGAVAEAYARIVEAQAKVAAASARPGGRREEIVARLLKRLHQEVRYTGVEFGEAAVVPRPPAEVLARKYGDCKDKSTLLVSWLRAEGVPAYLALLSAGPGADVDPELPGLGGFDHAIVVLPGTPSLWIDATDEFARAGELPSADQDRLALIAAPGTTALQRTPASSSADNTLRRTREYTFTDATGGRVVETTRTTGAVERSYRSYYARTEPKALRENQEKYAASELQAAVVAAQSPDPRDLSGPFQFRVESTRQAAGDGESATVTIHTAGLFSRLPDAIGDEPEAGATAAPRRQPFVFYEPHRVELVYKIVPPAGFVAKPLPEPASEQLGSARVEMRFESKPDGSVDGRLSFDTGPRVVDAKAFAALDEGVRRWRAREALEVEFEDRARALLNSGKICDALSDRRVAAEKAPKLAAPRERFALTLLEAGFGDAAREEARRAVALDPSSWSAQRALGWILEHDSLGRRFKPGWDPAAAEAAYRKAKELDPKSFMARAGLAILLEHNADGVHFGEGARLEDAAREVQALRQELKQAGLDANLRRSLMGLRRFEELETVSRSMAQDQDRDEMLVLAVAARRGVKAALAEASKLISDPKQRRDALLHVGNSLIELRLYPDGAALVAESAAGAEDAAERRARADVIRRVHRYEELKLDDTDPRAVVARFLIAIANGLGRDADLAPVLDLLELSPDERRDAARDAAGFRKTMMLTLKAGSGGGHMTKGVADIVLSLGQLVAEGDAEVGYRVKMQLADQSHSLFVVKRSDRYRIVATGNVPDSLASQAWDLVSAGHVNAATRWLDWAREELHPEASEDPLAGPAFLRLWPATGARNADMVRVASASLFASPTRVAQGMQALTVWRETLTDGPARRAVDMALLALSMRAQKPAEVLKVAERLAAAYPASTIAWGIRIGALRELGREADVRAAAEARLRQKPDDPDATRILAESAARTGQYQEAERLFARMVASGHATPGDLNNRAWNAVLRGTVDDAALGWAQQAAQNGHSSAALHTLASLYAEMGRVKESQQVLAQSIAVRVADEPRSEDWYVVGRLAEVCGLGETARAAYGRVPPDKEGRLDSTAILTKRGLERLAVPRRTSR